MHPPQGFSPELVPETSLLGRIQEKLAASRFLTYSLLFHVILLALASTIVVVTNMLPDEDFPAIVVTGEPATDIIQVERPRIDLTQPPKLAVPEQKVTPQLLEDVIVS